MDAIRKRPTPERTLRLVIVRDEHGKITEVVHDDPLTKVEAWCADADLTMADEVQEVTLPGGERQLRDVWTFDAIPNARRVQAWLGGRKVVLEKEPVEEPEYREEPDPPDLDDHWGVGDPEDYVATPQEREVLEGAQPCEPSDLPFPPDEAASPDGDNPNCDYCGKFVGYGLRADFPKLACEDCDQP